MGNKGLETIWVVGKKETSVNAEAQSWSQKSNAVGGVQKHDWTDDYCKNF